MKPLSSYRQVIHVTPRKVDYYEICRREVHIVHDDGCQRAMTADGLCTCTDPNTFEIGIRE